MPFPENHGKGHSRYDGRIVRNVRDAERARPVRRVRRVRRMTPALASPMAVVVTVEAAAKALAEDVQDGPPADAAVDPDDTRDVAREVVGQAMHASAGDVQADVEWLRDATRTEMAWRIDALDDQYGADGEAGLDHEYATEMVRDVETVQEAIARLYHDALVMLLTERTVQWVEDPDSAGVMD